MTHSFIFLFVAVAGNTSTCVLCNGINFTDCSKTTKPMVFLVVVVVFFSFSEFLNYWLFRIDLWENSNETNDTTVQHSHWVCIYLQKVFVYWTKKWYSKQQKTWKQMKNEPNSHTIPQKLNSAPKQTKRCNKPIKSRMLLQYIAPPMLLQHSRSWSKNNWLSHVKLKLKVNEETKTAMNEMDLKNEFY